MLRKYWRQHRGMVLVLVLCVALAAAPGVSASMGLVWDVPLGLAFIFAFGLLSSFIVSYLIIKASVMLYDRRQARLDALEDALARRNRSRR